MSHFFDIRHFPIFHILKAKALKLEGKYDEALTTLKSAIALPAFKEKNAKSSLDSKDGPVPTLGEKCTAFLEIVDCHSKLKQAHESLKAMQDATSLFNGTPEQDRVTIANAGLSLDRGDFDQALRILSAIEFSGDFYMESKYLMSQIYLKHKKDRKAYARCLSELVEQNPTAESYMMLGDAYMNILDPEKAISLYQQALEITPDNVSVASKLGKAYIKSHDYKRAIKFYESAIGNSNSDMPDLQFDLSELYKKMEMFSEAETCISEFLGHAQCTYISIFDIGYQRFLT